MIDPKSGSITFRHPAWSIGPELTRTDFLKSSMAEGARSIVANEPHHCWALGEKCTSELEFVVSLYFHGERLESVDLCHSDARFGASWDEWSGEKELQRKARHDQWLQRQVGRKRKFPWGTIWSEFDCRSGASTIAVQFGPLS